MRTIWLITLCCFCIIQSCSTYRNGKYFESIFGEYQVTENSNGDFSIITDKNQESLPMKFIIYDNRENRILIEDSLPKGGNITWHNDIYVRIQEFKQMPSISTDENSAVYFLKVPELTKHTKINQR